MNSQTPSGTTRPRSSESGWRMFFAAMSILAIGILMRATSLLAAPLDIPVVAYSESSGPLYAYDDDDDNDDDDNDDDDNDDDNDDDDNDDDADDNDNEDGYISQLGIITSQSQTTSGTWQIGNTSYSVTEQTQLDDDDSPLEVGACVEVKVAQSAPTVAIEVDSKEAYKCSNNG